MRTDPRVRVQSPPTSHPPTQRHHNGFRQRCRWPKMYSKPSVGAESLGSVAVPMACHRIGLDSNNITIKCPLIYMYSIHSHSHSFTLPSASSSSSSSAVCRAPCLENWVECWRRRILFTHPPPLESYTHRKDTPYLCENSVLASDSFSVFSRVFRLCLFSAKLTFTLAIRRIDASAICDAEVREEGWRPITIIGWIGEKCKCGIVWHEFDGVGIVKSLDYTACCGMLRMYAWKWAAAVGLRGVGEWVKS